MIGVKKDGRIYVHCTSKEVYTEVLRWKAQQRHRWPKSQDFVIADFKSRSEWDKYGDNATLGIYNNGAMCRLEKARERGVVISYSDFVSKYANVETPRVSLDIKTPEQDTYCRYAGDEAAPKQASKQTITINNSKKENNMKSILKNNILPSVIANDSIVLTMDGKVAYIRKNGEYTRYDKTQGAIIACSIFPNFKIGKMSFLVPTAYDALVAGDVVLHNNDYKEVVSNEGVLKAVNLNTGALSTIKKEIVEGFNFANLQKVTTLIGGSQASTNGLEFNPLMLMLFDKKGKDDSFESVLPFLLMNQAGGANNMQAMLPFLLLGDGKNDKMLQMMLLSGGLNNTTTATGGINPAMFLLMNDGDSEIDPMMFMAMQGGFGGNTGAANGGMNPMLLAAMASKGGDIDPMMLMMMQGGNPFAATAQVVAPVVAVEETETTNTAVAPAGAPSYEDLAATVKALSETVASLISTKKAKKADSAAPAPETSTEA